MLLRWARFRITSPTSTAIPYINLSVGIEYPELAREYGPAVPYDVDHKAHMRTEFGFDVLQVAKGRYAPENYHNFIGFEVSQPLLERAFLETYGLSSLR